MLQIDVLYNNVPHDTLLETDWGFACLARGTEKPILFDTGREGGILIRNMEKKGIEPESVGVLVLSRIHSDHTGGVSKLLARNRKMDVYVPASFPADFTARVETLCASLTRVDSPIEIMEGVWSTGEMGSQIKEQGLFLSGPQGGILLTGCAHPGIVDMVSRAKAVAASPVCFIAGGFHLLRADSQQVWSVIEELKRLGVEDAAPSHCTGEEQIRLFSKAFGAGFHAGGCGSLIRLEASKTPAPEKM